MKIDKQGRVYARLSDLKAGDCVELDDSFPCHSAGKVKLEIVGGELAFKCNDGWHKLASSLYLDSPDDLIGVYPVENTKVIPINEVITLENTTMVRELATKFANMMVEASDMAKIVHELRRELEEFKAQIVVANEAAARAITERDEAIKAKHRAEEIQAQAEHAYQSVNEARINAERETKEVKDKLNETNHRNLELTRKLDDAIAEVELLKEEVARLAKANEFLKSEHDNHIKAQAETHLTEIEKVNRNAELAIADAHSRADAKVAQAEAEKASAQLVAQTLRDERKHIQDELAVTANDLSLLRKIIAEAKLAADGIRGVLEGTMAAE
jgi:chromosome segregation ATPase